MPLDGDAIQAALRRRRARREGPPPDADTAVRALVAEGCDVTTVEAVLGELCAGGEAAREAVSALLAETKAAADATLADVLAEVPAECPEG